MHRTQLCAQNAATCTECNYMHRMQLYAPNTAMCTECSCMHRMQLNAQNAARCTECSCMQTIQLYAYTMWYMHRKPQYVQTETGNPPSRREPTLVDEKLFYIALGPFSTTRFQPSRSCASRPSPRSRFQIRSSKPLHCQGTGSTAAKLISQCRGNTSEYSHLGRI